MTKQETIKNHYITEFINSGMSQKEAEQKWVQSEEFINTDDGYFQNREEYYRPISLHGIETNNGWTSILSEKDLPSDETKEELNRYFWVMMAGEVFDVPKNATAVIYYWKCGAITHYQPITKPLPPIF